MNDFVYPSNGEIYGKKNPGYTTQWNLIIANKLIFFAILLALCYIEVPLYLEKFFWIY